MRSFFLQNDPATKKPGDVELIQVGTGIQSFQSTSRLDDANARREAVRRYAETFNGNLDSYESQQQRPHQFYLPRQKGHLEDVEEGFSPSTESQASNVQTQILQERLRLMDETRKNALFSAFQKNQKPELQFVDRIRGWLWCDCVNDGSTDPNLGLKTLMKFHFSTRQTTLKETSGLKPGFSSAEKRRRKKSLPIFGKFKKNRKLDPEVVRQLKDESSDYRPFFTYWITTVQILIMLFTLINYGIGTDFENGYGVIERSGNVMASYHSMVRIVIWEQNNIWLGPRFQDLIHLGAKYSPCMRRDPRIYDQLLRERRTEATDTGCCIAADGCYQSSECPKQFARLIQWRNYTSADGRSKAHRAVCGHDPRYCGGGSKNEPKTKSVDWESKRIDEWPICVHPKSKSKIPRSEEHMHCEITGRPCCIQMHGQCRITTKDYCDFVRGYYHRNATLCSQVNCLNDVCGMSPFISTDRPDQIYRLLTPLFIHAGIIRCVITALLQMTVMREFESVIGWLRLCIIYFVSGIGGYLASAIFVPYMPEVGPAGSQGGVLGALIVNVLYNWNYLLNPKKVLALHLGIAACLFLTGFLPFIDNWAQLFGFLFGCLLAAALVPYINFGPRTRHRRLIIVGVSLTITVLIFVVLFTIFYASPIIDNKLLTWLNCPFSGKVCDHQSLTLRSWLPI